MSPIDEAPPGFVGIRGPTGISWTRPEASSWVESALGDGATFYSAALSGESSLIGGRGQVRVTPSADGRHRWVVRHYRRGGALGPLWGDRFVRGGTPRPFAELEASERLRDRGVRTPRVMAAAFYPSGIFYRADLITELQGGKVLIDVVRSQTPGDAEAVFEGVAATIETLGSIGAYHVDLNAHNVLVDPDDVSAPWILDLDRMRFDAPAPQAVRAMTERLLRSLAKLDAGPSALELARRALPQ